MVKIKILKKIQLVGIYIFVAVFSVLGVAIIIERSMQQKQCLTNEREQLLNESAKISEKNCENILDSYIELLRVYSNEIDLTKIKNEDYLKYKLYELTKNNIFQNMSIYDLDGKEIFGTQKMKDIRKMDYFQNAVRGYGGISQNIYEGANAYELKRMRIAVPIYSRRNTVDAILVSDVVNAEIKNDIGTRAFEGSAYVSVINGKGDMIVGDRINFLTSNMNINYFDFLKQVTFKGNGESISSLKYVMKKRRTVLYHYQAGCVYYDAVYQPLSKNGWYLVMTVPRDVLSQNITYSHGISKSIARTTIAFLVVILFCLGVITYRTLCAEQSDKNFETMQKAMKLSSIKYNSKKKQADIHDQCGMVFAEEYTVLRGEEVYDLYDLVMEEDQSIRSQLRNFLDEREDFLTVEIRVKMLNGQYGWFQMHVLIERNRLGGVTGFTALVQNVDQQISEEKVLMQRAENDLLTGIYNKKTMESKVCEAIAEAKENEHNIFFIVDLDNFKAVNDNLGHIYGDHVIVDTAEKLKEVFHHKNSLVGRIGGDEFAVCVPYKSFDKESLEEYIEKKASQLRIAMQRVFQNAENKQVRVSSSVGIAVAPDHAEDFETLYKKADKALYLSKNSGKDCYHIYNESMEKKEN